MWCQQVYILGATQAGVLHVDEQLLVRMRGAKVDMNKDSTVYKSYEPST